MTDRGDTKYFVLDTNVLIHNPYSILSFKDNTVVIPIAVLEELDSLKRGHHEKSRNARIAIRFIGDIQKKSILNEGVKLQNNVTLKIAFDYDVPQNLGLSPEKVDNKIILTAYYLHKQNKPVFFISKDINARIKAMSIGLHAQDYEKERVNINELYKGFASLQIRPEEAALLNMNGSLDYPGEHLFDNQFIEIKTKDLEEPVLCRYRSKEKKLYQLKAAPENLWNIQPRNPIQRCAIELLMDDTINLVSLVGIAGTGKTLLALACALTKTIDERKYARILVSRPIVPMGKDIGFLPGSKEQKLGHWMQPIFDNLEYLCSSNSNEALRSYEFLLDAKYLELEALTYIRGRSLPKQFMIIDEAQNLTPHEVKTIVSRAGEDTKVVLTGDPYQIDNPYLDASSNGLTYLVERFKGQSIYGHITLEKSERSYLAELAAKLL